ncbi:MAG: spore coat protein [Halanaerobiaceae bacterium]|jgi:spore coat protein CotF|nr:spore coat protein [Halanaerobiaceae bacterium]
MNEGNRINRADFGAHETLEAHEILTDAVNSINQFELYRPHVRDQQLANIIDNQLEFMIQGYNGLVNYLQRTGKAQNISYKTNKSFAPKYGLRNPSPERPDTDYGQLNDRDIASGMLGCAKSSAIFATLASLECADPELRNMMKNCIINKIDMAYEVFQYMNERGYYQLPTMQDNTTNTLLNCYQPATV